MKRSATGSSSRRFGPHLDAIEAELGLGLSAKKCFGIELDRGADTVLFEFNVKRPTCRCSWEDRTLAYELALLEAGPDALRATIRAARARLGHPSHSASAGSSVKALARLLDDAGVARSNGAATPGVLRAWTPRSKNCGRRSG